MITNLKSSAGASEALLLYIDDLLRSLAGRSCQRASSGSILRRLDAPASSPRTPEALFVPLRDIVLPTLTTYMFTNQLLYTWSEGVALYRMSHRSLHDGILVR